MLLQSIFKLASNEIQAVWKPSNALRSCEGDPKHALKLGPLLLLQFLTGSANAYFDDFATL